MLRSGSRSSPDGVIVSERRVLLVIGSDGAVAGALGAARSVVIADVLGLEIARWGIHRVDWWARGAEARESAAGVLDFVAELGIEAVVVEHVQPCLREALAKLGIPVFCRGGISARAAAISAATVLALLHRAEQ